MPIHEYECTACGTFFEELVFGSENRVRCPECRSKSLKRLISAPSDIEHTRTLFGGSGAPGQTSCGASRLS